MDSGEQEQDILGELSEPLQRLALKRIGQHMAKDLPLLQATITPDLSHSHPDLVKCTQKIH